jgi:hypothetical protein
MQMIRTALVFAASLVFLNSGQTADKPKEGPVALERRLQGSWKGPACGGDWAFRADGTFAVEHYSPGTNKLTGTWEVRWNALPPTLVLTIKTSDAPERMKVGETWEVKLIQLDDESLAYEWPKNPGQSTLWNRVKK